MMLWLIANVADHGCSSRFADAESSVPSLPGELALLIPGRERRERPVKPRLREEAARHEPRLSDPDLLFQALSRAVRS